MSERQESVDNSSMSVPTESGALLSLRLSPKNNDGVVGASDADRQMGGTAIGDGRHGEARVDTAEHGTMPMDTSTSDYNVPSGDGNRPAIRYHSEAASDSLAGHGTMAAVVAVAAATPQGLSMAASFDDNHYDNAMKSAIGSSTSSGPPLWECEPLPYHGQLAGDRQHAPRRADETMQSIVAGSSISSGPPLDSSDCDPYPLHSRDEHSALLAMLPYASLHQPTDHGYSTAQARPIVHGEGSMLDAADSRYHGHAQLPTFDPSDVSMVTTEQPCDGAHDGDDDLVVYSNLLKPHATTQLVAPSNVPAAPQPSHSLAGNHDNTGLKVIQITNRAPSEVGAHWEIDSRLWSIQPHHVGSDRNIILHICNVENRLDSRTCHAEFKAQHELFARAVHHGQRVPIPANLVRHIVSLGGMFLHTPQQQHQQQQQQQQQQQPHHGQVVLAMTEYEAVTAVHHFLQQKCHVDYDAYLQVRMGRGGHNANHFGNQRFLNKRDQMRAAYVAERNPDVKRQMSQDLVDWVYATGGRFVAHVDQGSGGGGTGTNNDGNNSGAWYIVDNDWARRKAMQALREERNTTTRAVI